MSTGPADPGETARAIEALRARGAARVDPVRWRFIEALARRTAGRHGEVRRLLELRLAQLLAGYGEGAAAPAPAAAQRQPAPGTGLAELLAHLRYQGLDAAPRAATAGGTLAPAAELKAVSRHRDTWARLSVEQRLAQALALVPDNAGPLNTQRLLNQALRTMCDASPEYLQRIISHVDALLWLEQATLPARPAVKPRARRAGARPG